MADGSKAGMSAASAVSPVASVASSRVKAWLRSMVRPSSTVRIEASTTSNSDRVAATGRMRSPLPVLVEGAAGPLRWNIRACEAVEKLSRPSKAT